MRILHVIEAYGGGVAAAVADYIESTAEFDHWILRAARPAFDMGEPQGLSERIADLPASRLHHVSSVRHAVESKASN